LSEFVFYIIKAEEILSEKLTHTESTQ